MGRRNCTLMITHQCNLNCLYCYECNKDKKKMDFSTAQAIIEKEFQHVLHSREYNELAIDFIGGEPFIEFELMKSIAEWIWKETRPVPYICSATTNGTLLNDEIKTWLGKHHDKFKVILSFDGMQAVQDINRSNSFHSIDLDFFLRFFRGQPLKMTIAPQTVSHFSSGVISLLEQGFKVGANYAYGVSWNGADQQIYLKELWRLANYYLIHPEYEPLQSLQTTLSRALWQLEPQKFCGTGTAMSTYDVDGQCYPCHLFTPVVLGSDEAANMHKTYNLNAKSVFFDSRCKSCCYRNLCKTCYGFNYKEFFSFDKKKTAYCELNQGEIKVCIWYKSQLLKNKIARNLSLSPEEIEEAKAILYLMQKEPDMIVENKL